MDGTIYLGSQLIPGADGFLDVLTKNNLDFFFLTNNSSKDKMAYVDKLSRLGITVKATQVITSGEAAATYLRNKKPGAKVFLLGTESLGREFQQHGLQLVATDDNPDFVVLGFDTTLTYQKLWDACTLVRDGVEYVATHPDLNCPLEGGKYMPDTGSMIAFIEASTGRRPKVIGKPNKEILEAVLARTKYRWEQIAIIGDRLYTDIAMGHEFGLTTILVLSGESKQKDLIGSSFQPNYVFNSVAQLAKALDNG